MIASALFSFLVLVLVQQPPADAIVPEGAILPEGTAVPAAVLRAEAAWAGADVLLPLARSSDERTAVYAIRALGRLEDLSLVPALMEFLDQRSPAVREAAANALAQTFKRVNPQTEAAQIAAVGAKLRAGRHIAALGRLVFADAADIAAAAGLIDETFALTKTGADRLPARLEAAVAIESLVRRNGRQGPAGLPPSLIARLDQAVRHTSPNDSDGVRFYAFRALAAGPALTSETFAAALADPYDQVRRAAVQALAADTTAMGTADRDAAIARALTDPSRIVRVEAVQTFAKRTAAARGCAPLVAALEDVSPHVVNVTLDALAATCPGDADVTARLVREAALPPATGAWQRQAHALVALAGRAPDRAAAVLPAFAGHARWEVRMYAARAAAAARDETTLMRLADDPSDNVREAALGPLRALAGGRAEPAILAALTRKDYQVVRTAALLLKDTPPAPRLAAPIAAALTGLTADRSDTSRDPRMALLDALAIHGSAGNAETLTPLLKDADPRVAARAAEILTSWGHASSPATVTLTRPASLDVPRVDGCADVTMKSGARFRMRFLPDAAPVTIAAFRRLVETRHYYDSLVFQRVEPNFVVQGGGPGANEYAGLATYMRDEIAARAVRGAVGLSTRGRNTADGQIFIMYVDDPRLDHEFSIFAQVEDSDMAAVDTIQEGDAIGTMRIGECR